jgi:transketolase
MNNYIYTKNQIIRRIIDICFFNKEGHLASSLSVLDLIYCIYKYHITINNKNKFVLSKGHASLGLYAILEHFNILTEEESLETFCSFNSILGGHPTIKVSGVEASTGSLGHGMPISVGMALAKKIRNEPGIVFCLIGDGEANEGTTWESALLASHHQLDNLCCILDHNKSTDRALSIGNMIKKFDAFDWSTISINGHNKKEIQNALMISSERPRFILANTIKGFGVDCMCNNPEWHHKCPNEQEYNNIITTLNKENN